MSTVYRVFADDNLLYVGCSMYGAQRLQQHAGDKPWWPEATHVTLEHHDTREDALMAENEAIIAERPRYNVRSQRPRTPRPEPTTYWVPLKPCVNCFRANQSVEIPIGQARGPWLRNHACVECGLKVWGRVSPDSSEPLKACA